VDFKRVGKENNSFYIKMNDSHKIDLKCISVIVAQLLKMQISVQILGFLLTFVEGKSICFENNEQTCFFISLL
jgi:hypothetical protein